MKIHRYYHSKKALLTLFEKGMEPKLILTDNNLIKI